MDSVRVQNYNEKLLMCMYIVIYIWYPPVYIIIRTMFFLTSPWNPGDRVLPQRLVGRCAALGRRLLRHRDAAGASDGTGKVFDVGGAEGKLVDHPGFAAKRWEKQCGFGPGRGVYY